MSSAQVRPISATFTAGPIRASASFAAHLETIERKIPLRSNYEALGAAVAVAALTPLLAYAAMPAYSPVTSERLINAQQDNGWLMYRRNYESTGYAPFDQINAGNVGKLTIAFNH